MGKENETSVPKLLAIFQAGTLGREPLMISLEIEPGRCGLRIKRALHDGFLGLCRPEYSHPNSPVGNADKRFCK